VHTNDAETVVLAATMEKNLYETGEGDDHLDDAILLYQRAYYLLHNRYNGINLAFLLNCRADSTLDKTREEKIADVVWANRIRHEVLAICDKDWNDLIKRQESNSRQDKVEDDDLLKSQEETENVQKFWILVNRAEANLGLGNMKEYQKAAAQAEAVDHKDWMMKSFTTQVKALVKLLDKQANLIKMKWKEFNTFI
jgi:hypothetical protein